MIYLMTTVMLFFYSYSIRNYHGKGFKFLLFPVVAIIFLILSLQYGVGADYFNYIEMASGNKELGWIESKGEHGFILLNNFVLQLGYPQFIFVFTSFVQAVFIYLVFNELSNLDFKLHWIVLLFFIFLLIFFNSFNGIRQYTAVYPVVYSILLIGRRKKLLPLSLIFFASTFHYSALLFIPLIFVRNLVSKKINIFWFCFFTSASICFLFFDFTYYTDMVVRSTKYAGYIDSEYHASGVGFMNMVTKLPKLFSVYVVYFIIMTRHKEIYEKYLYYLNFSLVASFVLILSFSSGLIWRLYQYFDFFTLFPLLVILSVGKQKQLSILILIFLFFIFTLKVIVFPIGEYKYQSILGEYFL